MTVFILCSGRSGSTTFIKACSHITNYTAGHESRSGLLGMDRVAYPENHIEADNRLTWFLGKLDQAYGDDAFYVHLHRNRKETAKSFTKRFNCGGIITAYSTAMLINCRFRHKPIDFAYDYCETVESNILLFLKDKTRTLDFPLEKAQKNFALFWRAIGAQGDLSAALAEWDRSYNATERSAKELLSGIRPQEVGKKSAQKILRMMKQIPNFIKFS